MISVEEVKEFLKNADIPTSQIERAINLAYSRFVNLSGQPPQETEEHKRALLLLTVLELSSYINLYYRGQNNTELIRTKDLAVEVERLLNLAPKGAIVWQTI